VDFKCVLNELFKALAPANDPCYQKLIPLVCDKTTNESQVITVIMAVASYDGHFNRLHLWYKPQNILFMYLLI